MDAPGGAWRVGYGRGRGGAAGRRFRRTDISEGRGHPYDPQGLRAGGTRRRRDMNFLRQVSMKSGLPIVAGAGFYTQPFYPKEISSMSEEQVLQALMKQVESDPIGAFGEIGSWDYISKDERKVFRAIGKAHLLTNIPIFTHTGIPGKSALEQLDIFEDVGVDPKHVVIGHLGNLVDANTEVHRAVCRRGAFIGFDRQGGPGDEQVVPM